VRDNPHRLFIRSPPPSTTPAGGSSFSPATGGGQQQEDGTPARCVVISACATCSAIAASFDWWCTNFNRCNELLTQLLSTVFGFTTCVGLPRLP
jgi:hypothetical protein